MQDSKKHYIVRLCEFLPCICNRLIMKIKKSIRLNNDLIDMINNYAIENGMNFNEVVENSIFCNKKLNIKISNKKKSDSKKKVRSIRFDDYTLNKITKIAKNKNITVSEEIRFRLHSTLEMPCFDKLEMGEINQLRININQIGNLINMAVRENLLINNDNIIQLLGLINQIKYSLESLVLSSSKRLM